MDYLSDMCVTPTNVTVQSCSSSVFKHILGMPKYCVRAYLSKGGGGMTRGLSLTTDSTGVR